jgi:hypothetical protein
MMKFSKNIYTIYWFSALFYNVVYIGTKVVRFLSIVVKSIPVIFHPSTTSFYILSIYYCTKLKVN